MKYRMMSIVAALVVTTGISVTYLHQGISVQKMNLIMALAGVLGLVTFGVVRMILPKN
jgi:hypothetical protein